MDVLTGCIMWLFVGFWYFCRWYVWVPIGAIRGVTAVRWVAADGVTDFFFYCFTCAV